MFYSATGSGISFTYNSRISAGAESLRSMEQMLDIHKNVLAILDEILSLKGRSADMTENTPLLGAVPELDSMAVVGVIGAIEEHFGI